MKRFLSTHMIILWACLGANGQCGMTTVLTASPGCPFSTCSVNTTGGTAPYSILVRTNAGGGFQSVSQITGDADGDVANITYDAFGVSPMDVTVTDATGCVATHSIFTDLWMYPAFAGLPSLPDPCSGGGQIHFRLAVPTSGWSTLCPVASHSLYVNGVNAGPLLSTCVDEGGGAYHTIQAYAPGLYTVMAGNLACGSIHECWYGTTATVSSTTAGDCDVNINIRAALGGALQGGTIMSDGLRTANVITLTEPYTGLGYVFVGSAPGATMPAAVLSVNSTDAVVDWVILELRNSTSPGQVVYSKAALIQRDGDIMDPDGTPSVSFPVPDGSYYVAIRHRNHLGVMTATPQNLAATPGWVDFQSSYTTCYGTNARSSGTVLSLWAGDATGNGTLKYTGSGNDRDPIILAVGGTTPNNVVSNVYDRRDTNLDGVIKYTGTGNDRDIILTNLGSTTPNNTRTQQLP